MIDNDNANIVLINVFKIKILAKFDYSSEPRSATNLSTPSCNFLNSLCYARAENLPRIVTVTFVY